MLEGVHLLVQVWDKEALNSIFWEELVFVKSYIRLDRTYSVELVSLLNVLFVVKRSLTGSKWEGKLRMRVCLSFLVYKYCNRVGSTRAPWGTKWLETVSYRFFAGFISDGLLRKFERARMLVESQWKCTRVTWIWTHAFSFDRH